MSAILWGIRAAVSNNVKRILWAMATGTSQNPWIFVGLASSIPNIAPDQQASTRGNTRLCKPPPDPWEETTTDAPPPPCKIFSATAGSATELSLDESQGTLMSAPQVLVFRYRETLHAIDHACPHSSYPLSRGSVYDIEDFGIVLSAGITCPKHGWAFDLHTGNSDRGKYRLGIYEVDQRVGDGGEEEVWVRKKERKRIG